jgi:hypothetical protein
MRFAKKISPTLSVPASAFEKLVRFFDWLILLFLLFSVSSPFPFRIGSIIFWSGEPVAILFLIWWLLVRRIKWSQLFPPRFSWLWALYGFVIWAGMLWSVSENWIARTANLRVMLLGVPIFFILLNR